MSVTSVGDVDRPDESEQRVLDAISSRGVADFTGLPPESRRLRASFIEALVAGSGSDLPRLCCPLRIRGADIAGPIRALPANRDARAVPSHKGHAA